MAVEGDFRRVLSALIPRAKQLAELGRPHAILAIYAVEKVAATREALQGGRVI